MVDVIVVSVVAGSICLILNVLFWNLRRGRCTHVRVCKCIECTRDIMTTEEMQVDGLVNSTLSIPQI